MNKGLRLSGHRAQSQGVEIQNGIDDLMNKGLRLILQLHCSCKSQNGIDDLMNKGLRLPAPGRVIPQRLCLNGIDDLMNKGLRRMISAR